MTANQIAYQRMLVERSQAETAAKNAESQARQAGAAELSAAAHSQQATAALQSAQAAVMNAETNQWSAIADTVIGSLKALTGGGELIATLLPMLGA